jgi:alkanesulfonate monooxygenase SsuD/methylene tetrahydromethanopterin reductase-like flavin-dependent oxidoreductase (luciferase family)
MGTPVFLAATEQEAQAALARVPEERRPFLNVGTPERVADALRPYIDAGFTGFTFNNSVLDTPERIALAGELLRLVS